MTTARVNNDALFAAWVVVACTLLGICLVTVVICGREDTPITDDIRDVPDPSRPLFDAIRQVESGGNDLAVGDGGASRGPYQIGRAYWDDSVDYLVNQLATCPWKHYAEDFPPDIIASMLNYNLMVNQPQACELIMAGYWARYGANTDEERARIHNGGPRGMSKKSTEAYWVKVQAEMRK